MQHGTGRETARGAPAKRGRARLFDAHNMRNQYSCRRHKGRSLKAEGARLPAQVVRAGECRRCVYAESREVGVTAKKYAQLLSLYVSERYRSPWR